MERRGLNVLVVGAFSWRAVAIPLGAACLLAIFLGGWGIRCGLPSQERLELSLGGGAALDSAEKRIRQAFVSGRIARSEYIQAGDKPDIVEISPYLDQLRSFHPDEPYVVKTLARMGRARDIHPRTYLYGSFLMYQVGAGLAAGRVLGFLPVRDDLLHYFRHPGEFAPAYLIGRIVSALFGTAAVAVTFFIGLRLGGPALATVSAFLLASLPLQVLASKFVKPDAPAEFWSALALLASIPAVSRARVIDYVGSGVCVGLAAGSKYPAVISGGYLLAFHLLRCWRTREDEGSRMRGGKLLAAGTIAVVVTFVATNPACVLDSQAFWEDVRLSAANSLRDAWWLASLWDGGIAFFQDALSYTMGWPAVLAIGAGMILALARPIGPWPGICGISLVFFLYACQGKPGSDAYLLPAYPGLALMAGKALLHERLGRLRWILTIVVLVTTASFGWAYAQAAGWENPRLAAVRWINSNIPDGATIGFNQYPVGYRAPMVDPRRFHLLSADFDPAARQADYFVQSSFDWRRPGWRERLAGKMTVGVAPSGFEEVAMFENVPRALFGLYPLRRNRRLSPYIEVVAPRVVVYQRCGS